MPNDIMKPLRYAVASKLKPLFSFVILTLLFGLFVPHQVMARGVQEYTPSSVKDSVYKVIAYQAGDKQWSGTGWKVADGLMMTAGHVCDTEGEDGFTFRAISRWNKEYPLEVIKFSRSPDLCLMRAKNVPGVPMDWLVKTPEYGETVWYSGAPAGVFGDGTVPFARGVYIGGYRAMIAGYPGASGSAMYTREGVFGVLVAVWRGTHLVEFVPSWAIIQFLKE